MKLQVKVENRVFTVEVGDLYTRPVKVLVDDTPFDVWVENAEPTAPAEQAASPAPTLRAAPVITKKASNGGAHKKNLQAPIPGVIDSIAVVEGETVTAGQELLVIEAMKMKNIIRSTRPGTIAAIRVEKGQHVRHSDVLLEYAE